MEGMRKSSWVLFGMRKMKQNTLLPAVLSTKYLRINKALFNFPLYISRFKAHAVAGASFFLATYPPSRSKCEVIRPSSQTSRWFVRHTYILQRKTSAFHRIGLISPVIRSFLYVLCIIYPKQKSLAGCLAKPSKKKTRGGEGREIEKNQRGERERVKTLLSGALNSHSPTFPCCRKPYSLNHFFRGPGSLVNV